jgi:predicted MFS family arabinose efflux permease
VFWGFALLLFGLNTGMTYFSSMYYSLCGHLDLGGKSAWHESVIHSGIFFSTLIGGALANYINLKSPYIFCAGVIITGILVETFIISRRHNGGKINVDE